MSNWLTDLFSSNVGDQLRGQSTATQRLIDKGIGQINAVFSADPASLGVGQVDPRSIDPTRTYYGPTGQTFSSFDFTNPMFVNWARQNFGQYGRDMSFFQTGAPLDVKQNAGLTREYGNAVTQLQNKWKAFLTDMANRAGGSLYSGQQAVGGFSPQFYQQRATDYENWAMPQVAQQANQAQRQLAYNMANRGLLNSSAASDLAGSLQRETATQTQGVANQGVSLAQQLQQQVANEQAQLTQQLLTSASPATTTAAALNTAAGFQAPSVFAPIGNMFQNWANMYLAGNIAQGPQYPYTQGTGTVNASALPGNN